MPKLLLALFFSLSFCFDVFAANTPQTSIQPMNLMIAIQSRSSQGWVESPSITIHNQSQNCDVDASEVGKMEWMAITLLPTGDQNFEVKQVVAVSFNQCRIFFERVLKKSQNENSIPFVLLGVLSRSAKEFSVSYKSTQVFEQLKALSLETLNDAGRSSSNATSLVLLTL